MHVVIAAAKAAATAAVPLLCSTAVITRGWHTLHYNPCSVIPFLIEFIVAPLAYVALSA